MSLQKRPATIKVWDPLVRIFHWSLVIFFSIAYVTEDDFMQLHVWAGYGILGLVAFRLIWGLIGTRHARFTDFVKKPHVVFKYLRDILHGSAKRHLGHNPAGGAMVLLLLAFLTGTGISGVALYGIEEHAGPLAGWVQNWPHIMEDILEETHEFLANTTLLLIFVHIAGVLLASVQHGENLIASMWHGKKSD
jgi:cytochrome b